MTEDDLKAIEARCNAATGGPWAWEPTGEKSNGWCLGLACDGEGKPYQGRVPDEGFVNETLGECSLVMEHDAATCNYADPEFIAHARQDIPALIAEVRRLRTELGAFEFCAGLPGDLEEPQKFAEWVRTTAHEALNQ